MGQTDSVRIHAFQRTYRYESVEFWSGTVLGRNYFVILTSDGKAHEHHDRHVAAQILHGLRLSGGLRQVANTATAR